MLIQPNRYTDLEIRISPHSSDGYAVELTVNSEREFAACSSTDSLLPWRASDDNVADGKRLFDWLFADSTLLQAWAEIRGNHPHRRLRLRIDPGAAELHTIPWELLREAYDDAAAHDVAGASETPFSRYLAGRWVPGYPVLQRPLRILVAIANPTDTVEYGLQPLDVEAEWQQLQTAVAELDVDLTLLPKPCSPVALEAALQSGYHVLHFVGHGIYDETADAALLLMADDENRAVLVEEQQIAGLLARLMGSGERAGAQQLRLVFLAACRSAVRSPADAFRGLAPSLVQAGVPAVIAMQDLVSMTTARTFAGTFYRRLLTHGQVDLASNEARSRLLTEGLPGAAVPVLFMRLRDGVLLGNRGRIHSRHSDEDFWTYLLDYIAAGQCTPFLGPRVNAGLLPDAATISQRLARRHGYPLGNSDDLPKVAQYVALKAPSVLRNNYFNLLKQGLLRHLEIRPNKADQHRYSRMSFGALVAELNWLENARAARETVVQQLLAELELPLYVTTNADTFMAAALRAHLAGEADSVREIGLRWDLNRDRPAEEKFVIAPAPSREAPVVLYLNGHDGDAEQAQHMVLSEDDYLGHFVRIARDRNDVLPMNVLQLLAQNSFLFLGYSLDDWEFRIVLQALLGTMAKTGGQELHVGVQLDVSDDLASDEVLDYFHRYLGRFNIDIYWGSTQQFMTELHNRWAAYSGGWDDW